MKDLNFFEPYIEKKEFKLTKSIVLYYLMAIICLGLVFYAAFNQFKIIKLSYKVNELQVQVEDPDTLTKISDIKVKKEEMDILELEVKNVEYIDKVIESKETVSDDLIRNITHSLPKDTYITSITIYGDSVTLFGVSNDKFSIAEFARALESVEGLNDIYISSISTTEDRFNFNLDIILEGEVIDGEDEVDKT